MSKLPDDYYEPREAKTRISHAPEVASRVPVPMYAVIRGNRVLIVGHPGVYGWLAEDDPQQHNCDAMGCSSLEHVIANVPLDGSSNDGRAEHG